MRKIFVIIAFITCPVLLTQAQKSDYRIFGRITTVENKILTGYITWNENKLWWIDFFEASKKENPYASYFKNKDNNYQNNNYYLTKSSIHSFICRFGDISKIRLIGSNTIELEIKDGNFIELKKSGANDIGRSIQLFDGVATYSLKWEQVSEVEFSAPDSSFVASPEIPLTGTLRSTQGIYKGVISWNDKKNTLSSAITGWNTASNISIPFRDITQIARNGSILTLQLKDGNEKKLRNSGDFSYSASPVSVNMPNVGIAYVPWLNFDLLEIIPVNSIDLPSYNDFKAPQRITGDVIMRSGQKVSGTIAYDLDESMDIEVLDGKNDNINYRIPFKYIQSVEPKNYKYSFITLRNGSTLSLGDSPDVNETNSGIIVFSPGTNPVYIQWKEVKKIIFH